MKRFPVAKRSSDFNNIKKIHEQKRSTNPKQTDPKVEKDLINIFNAKQDNIETTTDASINKSKKDLNKKTVEKKNGKNKKILANTKEETPQMPSNDKPLQIKKIY